MREIIATHVRKQDDGLAVLLGHEKEGDVERHRVSSPKWAEIGRRVEKSGNFKYIKMGYFSRSNPEAMRRRCLSDSAK
jgi:hypothetical protein